MIEPKRRDVSKRSRRNRPRPMPKWLKEREGLEETARRRCLLMLSVLSGEKPVTDAIAEAGMSRGRYYQLEERAIQAMLESMLPTPGPGKPPDQSLKLAELEKKISRLEQEKRRMERLLFLTRKVVRKGPLTLPGLGRPPSTRSGKKPSSTSVGTTKTATPVSPSIPRSTGAAAP
jgi:hypothetical protein